MCQQIASDDDGDGHVCMTTHDSFAARSCITHVCDAYVTYARGVNNASVKLATIGEPIITRRSSCKNVPSLDESREIHASIADLFAYRQRSMYFMSNANSDFSCFCSFEKERDVHVYKNYFHFRQVLSLITILTNKNKAGISVSLDLYLC